MGSYGSHGELWGVMGSYEEPVDKPGSVESNHSSRTTVAESPLAAYPDPTRTTSNGPLFGLAPGGMPSRACCQRPRCALTAPFHPCRPEKTGGLLSVASAAGSRPPGVTWHPVLWSPDFPHALLLRTRGCLTDSPPSIVLSFAPQGDGLFVQRAARRSRDSGGELGRLGGREFICEGVQDGLRIARRRCRADV